MLTICRRRFCVLAICLITWFSTPAVFAQTLYDFNLPQQALADSLRAIGHQTSVNILFDPRSVEKLTAPAVHGKFSASQAVNRILAGTNLAAEQTEANTLLVEPKDKAGKAQAAATLNDPPDDVRGSSSEGSQGSALEEIVVSATRRAENIQQVPVSVAALSESFIQDTGAQQLQDVVRMVPGLSFNPGSSGNESVTIRGVNTSSATGNSESPVGYYLDEVPLLSPATPTNEPALRLFDIDRIEVLKGPQGTLFGAASLGGAIRILTKKPDATQYEVATEDTIETTAQGGVSYATNVMLNAPLIQDQLALRLVGFYTHDGGWIDNSVTGEKNQNYSLSSGGRAMLRWTPTQTLSLTAAYYDERDAPHDSAFTFLDSKSFVYNNPVPNNTPTHLQIFNILGEYKMPWATLISSTSEKWKDEQDSINFTPIVAPITGLSAPAPLTDIGPPTEDFIEELRLVSAAVHPLKWQVGAYFQNFHRDVSEYTIQAGAGAVFAGIGFPSDRIENDRYTTRVDERALFGEVSYDLTSTLTATAGVRLTHESVGATAFGNAYLDCPGYPCTYYVQNGAVYNKATPKFVLSYAPQDNLFFYGEVANGFRAGGSNLDPPKDPASGQPIPGAYGPDQLWNYELGAKTTWWDGRLLVDGAIYQINWTQIQLNQVSVPSGLEYTSNAGAARIRGVELQVVAKPIKAVEFGITLSYDDAKLTSVDPNVNALVGDQLPGSAPFTGYVYDQYSFKLGQNTSAFVRADYSYTSREYSDLNNPTAFTYGNYGSAGAQLGLTAGRCQWLLFANNLGDSEGLTNARNYFGSLVGIRQTPRTIGLTFRAHW
jgi:iron complex outermembrane receptor protein